MKLNITPGEWHTSRDAVPDGYVQITVYADSTGTFGQPHQKRVATVFDRAENALFIAKAPATFAALEKLADTCELVQVDLDDSMTGWYYQFKQALHEAQMQMRRAKGDL